jgi:tripartite-type tricarboxylate transporter receptor subunit TctC
VAQRANPDKLSHCSAGNGTLSHVVMEDFKRRAGIRILHVPYQGSPPAMQDLIAGTVQVAMDTVTVTKPHIDSGRVRLIAAGTLERLPTWPDTPTIAEQGFPGLEAVAWLGIMLPAKTPAERVKQLSDAVVKAMKDPTTAGKVRTVGALPRPMDSAAFAAFLKSEDARWSQVIVASGIKAD